MSGSVTQGARGGGRRAAIVSRNPRASARGRSDPGVVGLQRRLWIAASHWCVLAMTPLFAGFSASCLICRSFARSASVSAAATGQSLLSLFVRSSIRPDAAAPASDKRDLESEAAHNMNSVVAARADEVSQCLRKRGGVGLVRLYAPPSRAPVRQPRPRAAARRRDRKKRTSCRIAQSRLWMRSSASSRSAPAGATSIMVRKRPIGLAVPGLIVSYRHRSTPASRSRCRTFESRHLRRRRRAIGPPEKAPERSVASRTAPSSDAP